MEAWLSAYKVRVSVLLSFYLVIFSLLVILSRYSYILFHSLAEILVVVIASGVFMITWNARYVVKNGFVVMAGIAFLFIGIAETLHALAYKGMGVFEMSQSGNLATQLWLVSRYIMAVTWCLAPFFINKSVFAFKTLLRYAFVFVVLIASVFIWKIFPVAYFEGTGQTFFKVASEYVISFMFAISAIYIYKKRKEMEKEVVILLVTSLCLSIIAELVFTIYVNVYAISNLIGHLLLIAAYSLVYEAFIALGLQKPYSLLFLDKLKSEQKMREERDRNRRYLDIANVIFVVINKNGDVELINKKGCEVLDCKESDVLGKNWFANFVPKSIRESLSLIFKKILAGELIPFEYYENPIINKQGEERDIAWRNTVLRDEVTGEIVSILSAGEDITEYKKFQEQVNMLNMELGALRKDKDLQIKMAENQFRNEAAVGKEILF